MQSRQRMCHPDVASETVVYQFVAAAALSPASLLVRQTFKPHTSAVCRDRYNANIVRPRRPCLQRRTLFGGSGNRGRSSGTWKRLDTLYFSSAAIYDASNLQAERTTTTC